MDAKDCIFVFVLWLLSLGLFGSLTYCVWNKQTEVANELQNELADVQNQLLKLQNERSSEVQSELQNELKNVFQAALNSKVHLGGSEPSQDKGQLKRNVREADEDTAWHAFCYRNSD